MRKDQTEVFFSSRGPPLPGPGTLHSNPVEAIAVTGLFLIQQQTQSLKTMRKGRRLKCIIGKAKQEGSKGDSCKHMATRGTGVSSEQGMVFWYLLALA